MAVVEERPATLPQLQNPITNDPFDNRLYSNLPYVGKIARGYIVSHQPSTPAYRFRFLYNPNQFTYSFNYNPGQKNASNLDQSANAGSLGMMGGITLSLSTFVDRIYEVSYGGDKRGVQKDIEVLRGLTGSQIPNQYMVENTLRFILGHNHVFYGVITSMQIDIAFFSEDMVPMRANIGLGVMSRPADTTDPNVWATTPSASMLTPASQKTQTAINKATRPGVTRSGPARPSIL